MAKQAQLDSIISKMYYYHQVWNGLKKRVIKELVNTYLNKSYVIQRKVSVPCLQLDAWLCSVCSTLQCLEV